MAKDYQKKFGLSTESTKKSSASAPQKIRRKSSQLCSNPGIVNPRLQLSTQVYSNKALPSSNFVGPYAHMLLNIYAF